MSASNLRILAGDIGGTKTTLGLFDLAGALLRQDTFESQDYEVFESLLGEFLASEGDRVVHTCLAVAGPVVDESVDVTNLPWVVRAANVRSYVNSGPVHLINDIEAIAWAIPSLAPEDLCTLRQGDPEGNGVRAVIAPGTGLGEAFLIEQEGRVVAFSGEGGHANFAPTNELQIELLRFLLGDHDHVSYERVASGSGIPHLYRFFRDGRRMEETGPVSERIEKSSDPTRVILRAALDGTSAPCEKTLGTFVSILGAEAGNLALRAMATEGIYLGGGIPRRILPALQQPAFLEAFDAKGRFTGLMRTIPVHVIIREDVALFGAATHAQSKLSASTA